MKKLLIATAALSLMCGSAFAQGTTGPAAQQDNMTKPGMAKDNMDKGSMNKTTTGTDKGGTTKDTMSKDTMSKDGTPKTKGDMNK
jgi:pentapeptide MXKDX repeat protein